MASKTLSPPRLIALAIVLALASGVLVAFLVIKITGPLSASVCLIDEEKWITANIRSVQVPQLAKIPSGPQDGSVQFNIRAAEALKSAWREVEERILLDRVLSWDGAFVSDARSPTHACGLAFDINSAWNARGREPPPVETRGSIRELVP